MADELKLKIVLDDGSVRDGFLSVEKQAKDTSKKIGNSFNSKGSGIQAIANGAEAASGGIASMAASAARALGPYGALATAIIAASVAQVKFALEGEKANAVNVQFANIAKSSGLQVDSFKQSIIEATQGLIDDKDALQIATTGIIALGENAAKIPAILDASRSISRALGKDFKESFQNLSQFVETGNVRILRQYGIILDLDSAYKKAAKSIGLTSSELSEQQKQTVRANLALDEIPKKFSSAAQSVTPLKDAYDRLGVSISKAFGNVQTVLAESFTRVLIDKSDLSNVSVARLNARLKEAEDRAASAAARINEINLDKLGSRSVQASAEISGLNDELKRLAIERSRISSEIADQREVQRRLDAQGAGKGGVAPTALTRNPEQEAAALERRKKAEADLTAFQSAEELKRINNTTQTDQLKLANATTFAQSELLIEQIAASQKAALDAQFAINKQAAEKQFAGNSVLEVQNRNAAILAVEATHASNLEALNKKTEDEKLKTKKKFNAAGLSATSQALGQIATLQESSSTELAAIGKAAAISQATIDGYLAVQNALAQVPYPFNFAAAALVGVAAAANVAKIAGGGGKSNFSPDAGGGIAASPSPSTELAPTESLTRQEPGTQVSVVIQGDVLDSDESGSRIVRLINDAFDKKGVVISQGAFA